VDGIHASRIPRAGYLVPLGANGRFPDSVGLAGPQGPQGQQGPGGPPGVGGGWHASAAETASGVTASWALRVWAVCASVG
jgi:hypothetical protein